MRYFLELCLKSVQAAIANIDAEIIVVDNDSSDDSCQMVKTLFPDVILIENKANFGFSKGNNIGVLQAKGEYLCILNPDTVVAEDTFTSIMNFAESTPDLGIVGCKLINGVGEFLPESKRNIPYVKTAFKKLFGDDTLYYANHLTENQTGKVPVLVGAFMFLKQDVYKMVKGFDEDYFMYGEDIDLSYKILKSGRDNYYFGSTTVIHYKGESTWRDKHYARRFYGAMQIFYKKHFKKNIAFDLMVSVGIRLVYFFRNKPKKHKKIINEYVLVSNVEHKKMKSVLDKHIVLQQDLKHLEKHTEVIFDAKYVTYKAIISAMETADKQKSTTYKILPHNSNFIIGSDNTVSRGEIIDLN